eukprot:GHVU01209817.1.p1 GENE.GHVU01209817.1~~GHVU01209817.1.p1  ORF type:complete len:1772 (+),score=271.80 GHVU01209817.1:699-5318(+)
MKTDDAFVTMEEGVDGICETIYSVVKEPLQPEFELRVAKARNTKNCKAKPKWMQGIFVSAICPTCENIVKKDLIESSVYAKYNLTGTRFNPLIKSAIVESKHAFQPYNVKGGEAVIETMQKLILLEKRELREATYEVPRNMVPIKEGLLMMIPNPLVNGPIPEINPDMDVGVKAQRVEELINRIVAEVTPVPKPTTPLLIAELVTVLRECNSEDLRNIVKPLVASGDIADKRRELVLHVLPGVATPDSIPIIVELISSKAVSPLRATIILTTVASTMTPTPKAISQLIRLYKDAAITESKTGLVRRSIILAAGALTHRLVILQKNVIWNKAVITSARKSLAGEMIGLLKAATETKERITILKAIANAGLVEFLPELQKIIKVNDIPASVRIEAVYALRKIAPVARMNALQVLLPVVLNRVAPTKLRMAAFVVAMEARPRSETLKMLVAVADKEPNGEVKSLIVTYLRNLQISNFPCHRDLKIAARRALAFAGHIRIRPFSSMAYFQTAFLENLKIGASAQFTAKKSARSLPYESIGLKIDTMIVEQAVNLFEAGIQTSGLQGIIRKVLGPNAAMSHILNILPKILANPELLRETVVGIVSRSSKLFEGSDILARILEPLNRPSFAEAESEIKRIIEKIDIKEREMDDVLASAFIRVFGNDLTFVSLEKEDISDLFNTVVMNLGGIKDMLYGGIPFSLVHTLPLVDNSLVLPTPTGFPIALNLTVVTLATAEGRLAIKTPGKSIDEIISQVMRSGRIPEVVVRATSEFNPAIAVAVVGSMSLDAYQVRVGSSIRATSVINPHVIKSTYGIDTRNMKIFMDYDLARQQQNIFKLEVDNPVFVSRVPFRSTEMEAVETIDPRANRVIKFEGPYIFTRDVFGYADNIKYEANVPVASWSPLPPLNSKVTMRADVIPNSDAPRKFTIQIMPTFPTEELIMETVADEVVAVVDESARIRPARKSSWMSSWWNSEPEVATQLEREEEVKEEIYRGMGYSRAGAAAYDAAELLADIGSAEIGRAATTRSIYGVIKSVGGARERRADIKITLASSADWLKQKLIVQASRTPIPGESEPWKMTIEKVLNLRIASPETKEIFTLVAMAGPISAQAKLVEAVIVRDQSMASWPAGVIPKTAVEPIGIAGVLKFSPALPRTVRRVGLVSINYMKMYLWNKISLYLPEPELTNANEVRLYAKIIPVLKRAEVLIKTPLETIAIPNLGVCPIFLPRTPTEVVPFMDVVEWEALRQDPVDELITRTVPNVCVVKAAQISTFDGVTLDLPTTECEVILAKDCSPQRLFVITAERLVTEPEKKIVKLIIPGYVIKIVPSSYGAELFINDRRQAMPVSIVDEVKGTMVLEAVKVNRMVKVVALKYGVSVLSTGIKVITKVSPVYYGATCGICGDFNGEAAAELTGPAMRLFEKPEHFMYSYLLPTATCDPAAIHLKSGLHHLMATAPCEKLRNKVIPREHMGRKEVCVSIEPVKQCGASCSPALVHNARVEFHCMPAHSTLARTLVEEHHVRPLYELRDKPVDHVEVIAKAGKCVPAY